MFGKLKPQLRYDDIYQIDPELLRARGIRGLFFDIDNTLEPYAAPVPGERLSAWLASLLDAGFSVGILSNAKKNRIAGFVAGFPEAWSGRVLYLYGAAKP